MALKRVCLVEDSVDLQKLVQAGLGNGYEVISAGTISEAKECVARETMDMVLLDVNLPDGSGFDFCAELRSHPRTQDWPIIILSVRSELESKIKGFSRGADDYISKPFEPIDLRARVEAVLRRSERSVSPPAGDVIFGELKFDRIRLRLYMIDERTERDINLTPFEFKLLFFLASKEGQIFNRSELLKHVLEPNTHIKQENIYTHISAIRKKLADKAAYLECVPRVGYCFRRPPDKPLDQ